VANEIGASSVSVDRHPDLLFTRLAQTRHHSYDAAGAIHDALLKNKFSRPCGVWHPAVVNDSSHRRACIRDF
jgi:hypothetical protein